MFNKFFNNTVQNLDINSNLERVTSTLDTFDPILSTIKNMKNIHASLEIKGQ